jgi:hypothetical protein
MAKQPTTTPGQTAPNATSEPTRKSFGPWGELPENCEDGTSEKLGTIYGVVGKTSAR